LEPSQVDDHIVREEPRKKSLRVLRVSRSSHVQHDHGSLGSLGLLLRLRVGGVRHLLMDGASMTDSFGSVCMAKRLDQPRLEP